MCVLRFYFKHNINEFANLFVAVLHQDYKEIDEVVLEDIFHGYFFKSFEANKIKWLVFISNRPKNIDNKNDDILNCDPWSGKLEKFGTNNIHLIKIIKINEKIGEKPKNLILYYEDKYIYNEPIEIDLSEELSYFNLNIDKIDIFKKNFMSFAFKMKERGFICKLTPDYKIYMKYKTTNQTKINGKIEILANNLSISSDTCERKEIFRSFDHAITFAERKINFNNYYKEIEITTILNINIKMGDIIQIKEDNFYVIQIKHIFFDKISIFKVLGPIKKINLINVESSNVNKQQIIKDIRIENNKIYMKIYKDFPRIIDQIIRFKLSDQ